MLSDYYFQISHFCSRDTLCSSFKNMPVSEVMTSYIQPNFNLDSSLWSFPEITDILKSS